MSTANFGLAKIDEKDLSFSDYLARIQELTNSNLDLIDSALSNLTVVTVSGTYVVSPTVQFISIDGGTPILTFPPAASVSVGKVYYVGNNTGTTARLQPTSGTINGAANVSLSGSYTMKTVVKSPTEWIAY